MEDGTITPEWCAELASRLEAATWRGVAATSAVLPAPLLARVLKEAHDLLKAEPTLVEVRAPAARACQRPWWPCCRVQPVVIAQARSACLASPDAPAPTTQLDAAALGGLPVTIVGDTHGQYHDVLRM